jgi:hypothetical protein
LLFKKDPNILLDIITMVSPGYLVNNRVSIQQISLVTIFAYLKIEAIFYGLIIYNLAVVNIVTIFSKSNIH